MTLGQGDPQTGDGRVPQKVGGECSHVQAAVVGEEREDMSGKVHWSSPVSLRQLLGEEKGGTQRNDVKGGPAGARTREGTSSAAKEAGQIWLLPCRTQQPGMRGPRWNCCS